MKILYIAHWANSIYDSLFESLIKQGMNLKAVVCSKYSNLSSFNQKKYIVEECIDYTSKLNLLKNPDFPVIIDFPQLKKTIKKEKPDIVIANLFYMPGTWRAARYCRKNKISFILQTEEQRMPQDLIKRFALIAELKIFRNIFYEARLIICWTSDGVDFAKKHFGIKNKQKIKLIPAGVNTNIFYKVNSRKKDPSILKLLCIARFLPYKRHIDLFKAVKYLKDNSNLKIRLSLIGSGPIEKQIKEQIINLGLEKEVVFLKKRPPNKLKYVYCANDILILSSYNEAIGMVVPEAMACGLPVIISDTVGAKTYVKDGENALIFKTFDYVDLAKNILLLKDPKKRALFGKRAQEHIRSHFNLEIVANKFINSLKNLK